MCEDMFTEAETERQDYVDNAIYSLMIELAEGRKNKRNKFVQWDMEDIGEIRDVIQEILVNRHEFMTEQEFYPYRESDAPIPKPEPIVVDDETLFEAVRLAISGMDADNFAKISGFILGGQCRYNHDDDVLDTYTFEPDSTYSGALNTIEDDITD